MLTTQLPTTREIGNLGEDIACKWLKNHGYLVVERNYNRKWGELDIIAAKDKILHFIEVKSMTVKTSGQGSGRSGSDGRGYRPEENVHELKMRRLKRAIQTYLLEKRYPMDAEFKFHVVTVFMNPYTRRARVEFLENIIL